MMDLQVLTALWKFCTTVPSKGIVHPKIVIIIYPHFIPYLYDFRSYAEKKIESHTGLKQHKGEQMIAEFHVWENCPIMDFIKTLFLLTK